MKVEHPNFKGKDGRIFLVRCPKCKRENWAMAVAGGACAWCGFDANGEYTCTNASNANENSKGG